jgi:hypothetical protein
MNCFKIVHPIAESARPFCKKVCQPLGFFFVARPTSIAPATPQREVAVVNFASDWL